MGTNNNHDAGFYVNSNDRLLFCEHLLALKKKCKAYALAYIKASKTYKIASYFTGLPAVLAASVSILVTFSKLNWIAIICNIIVVIATSIGTFLKPDQMHTIFAERSLKYLEILNKIDSLLFSVNKHGLEYLDAEANIIVKSISGLISQNPAIIIDENYFKGEEKDE